MTHLLAAVLAAAVLAIMAAFSVWLQEPIIMPSVASAIFLQTMTPTAPSARLWNTGIGQLVGAAAGFLGVFVADATMAPHFLAHHPLLWSRVLAIGIAAAVTGLVQPLLKATSAAGGATAIVVATGVESATWAGAGRLTAGILLVTALGEACRLLLLRRQQSAAAD